MDRWISTNEPSADSPDCETNAPVSSTTLFSFAELIGVVEHSRRSLNHATFSNPTPMTAATTMAFVGGLAGVCVLDLPIKVCEFRFVQTINVSISARPETRREMSSMFDGRINFRK